MRRICFVGNSVCCWSVIGDACVMLVVAGFVCVFKVLSRQNSSVLLESGTSFLGCTIILSSICHSLGRWESRVETQSC